MNAQERNEIQVLIAAEAWSEARGALEKTRESDADDIDWLSFRAQVESGDGRLDEAVATYEKILAKRPDHRGALYNSSVALSDLGRHADAMTALEALVEVEGETAAVLNDLSFESMEAGHDVPGYLSACRAEQLAADESERCVARLNAATALANMGRRTDSRARIEAMLRDCTGACGERDAADELRKSLDPRHPRRIQNG